MRADSISLRHFVIGKFTQFPLCEYQILAFAPADDFKRFSAVRTAMDPILKMVAAGRTTDDVRLVVPTNMGTLYIRQFASIPPDAAGRPVSRAHVVLLDEPLLEELGWRPWVLDPWLASGIGRDRLEGPGGMDQMVVADQREVALPIEVPRSELPGVSSLPADDGERVALGVQYLKKGWSLCIREERTSPEVALEIVAGLLAATHGTVGVALDVPPAVFSHEDLVQRAILRVMYLRAGAGRIPDNWPELALIREPPTTAHRETLPQRMNILVSDAAQAPVVPGEPSPTFTSVPPPVITSSPRPEPRWTPPPPPRENRPIPRNVGSVRYGARVLGALLAISLLGNAYFTLGPASSGNRAELAQWREFGQLIGDTDAQSATLKWNGLASQLKTASLQAAGAADAGKRARTAEEKLKSASEQAEAAEKRASAAAARSESVLWAWEYAAGRLAHDLKSDDWRDLIRAVEKIPADRSKIRDLLPNTGHSPRTGNNPPGRGNEIPQSPR